MLMKLLLVLAALSTSHFLSAFKAAQEHEISAYEAAPEIAFLAKPERNYPVTSERSRPEIGRMLRQEGLSPAAANKVLTTLKCAKERQVEHNSILTVIDYSLPSSEKRLWIFDLIEKKLLFHTYVSHGIKSGQLLTEYFSNQHNSKASSIGVYHTENHYYGRHGLSLKLDGLEKDFNHHAFNRFIVMHGGWYVREDFIKKYGRPGRSWGCPVVPDELTKPIIDTIKDKSLFVAYYPSQNWFMTSKFLNCEHYSPRENANTMSLRSTPPDDEREDILFADMNNNNKREEHEPVVVVQAEHYARIFQKSPPLTRMLRRQINEAEYIALTQAEFKSLEEHLHLIDFVVPEVKMQRGYYATEMKKLSLGKIKDIKFNSEDSTSVSFDTGTEISLKPAKHFIRWLGL